MIEAKIIADSANEFGDRITTMVVTFPRFILAELNTHRMMSRNSASSRAIPFAKLVKSVEDNPFIPIAWQKDHPGMQGTSYFTDEKTIEKLNFLWLRAKDNAIREAKEFLDIEQEVDAETGKIIDIGLTKQLVNRLLEPFMNHTVIITATEWENFFYLRCPKYSFFVDGIETEFRSRKDAIAKCPDLMDTGIFTKPMSEMDWMKSNKGQAEIHMMALAEAMWDAYNESTPIELKPGGWHIPFGDNIDLPTPIPVDEGMSLEEGVNIRLAKIATARCARISYTVVGEEGKPANLDNDIKLHDRLAASGHWSPFEHCAKAMSELDYDDEHEMWSGNFFGFVQYRKMFDNENIVK